MIEFGPPRTKLTVHEAWLYCLTLDYAGHKDWRLPTWDEYLYYRQICGWHQHDSFQLDVNTATDKHAVTPVRNKDD